MAVYPVLTWKVGLTGNLKVSVTTGATTTHNTVDVTTSADVWGFAPGSAGAAASDSLAYHLATRIDTVADVAIATSIARRYIVDTTTPYPRYLLTWTGSASQVVLDTAGSSPIAMTDIGMLGSNTSTKSGLSGNIISECNALGWWSPNIEPTRMRPNPTHEYYHDVSPLNPSVGAHVYVGSSTTWSITWDAVDEAYVLSYTAAQTAFADRASRDASDPNNLLEELLRQLVRGAVVRMYTADNAYKSLALAATSRPRTVLDIAPLRPDEPRMRTVTLVLREVTE